MHSNKALKLQLASLRGLIAEIPTEIRKPTIPTAPQTVVRQVPDAAPEPSASQQPKEKRKRTGSRASLPTSLAAEDCSRGLAESTDPSESTNPCADTYKRRLHMHFILATEADGGMVIDLIGKRVLHRRRRSLEEDNEEERMENTEKTGAEGGRGADSTGERAGRPKRRVTVRPLKLLEVLQGGPGDSNSGLHGRM
ncbi:hypothetical protein FPQ18DRAFT_306838 [Pyronema domesticum]|nr:hypothetical protein FPQ18DRAFT_306838 [Pyronema domesticum]